MSERHGLMSMKVVLEGARHDASPVFRSQLLILNIPKRRQMMRSLSAPMTTSPTTGKSLLEERDWGILCDVVFKRAKTLIKTGVWSGIDEDRLINWIMAFENHSTKVLGALLLDSLIYRSDDQFDSLLRAVFNDDQLRVKLKLEEPLGLLLSSKNDLGFRIAPVIGLKSPPTKSGPYVLRVAQRLLSIFPPWMIWPQNAKDHIGKMKALVLLDDVCGTGTQFLEFGERTLEIDALLKADSKLEIVYLTAAAHEEGLKAITKRFPSVHCVVGEYLDQSHDFFGTANLSQYGVDGLQAEVGKKYDELVSAVGIPARNDVKAKYSRLGLCYGFSHSTPNNTLPVFWYDTPTWPSLLNR